MTRNLAASLHSPTVGQTIRPADALGKAGEKFAADFYRARGAQVIAANVHYRVGELDLVVRESDGTIVFCEVKTRATRNFGVVEAVTPRKLKRLRKAAAQWLSTARSENQTLSKLRFDVLGLVATGAHSGEAFEVEYFQGVDHGSR